MKAAICVLFLAIAGCVFGQEKTEPFAIEYSAFRSNILLHSPDLAQLITGHPEGAFISFSRKTNGSEAWQSIYNYPDYGAYFLYQDFKNGILGRNYAIGVQYDFYFLHRNLVLKVAEGFAITTNPYNKVTNPKNSAFGSKYMSNTDFIVDYKKENIVGKLGLQAGFIFTHFSIGRVKSPNSGINTYGFNLGLNYNLGKPRLRIIDTTKSKMRMTEPIRFDFLLRAGVNESPIIGSGQKPFYHIGAYADKRINRKSAIQLGAELFLTESYKEYIKFEAIAYPENGLSVNTDYKRVGVFIGHELFINRLSVETQLGYYVYQPFKFDKAVYDRVGVKYYILPKVFAALSVKTHGFLAEALEAGIGTRL